MTMAISALPHTPASRSPVTSWSFWRNVLLVLILLQISILMLTGLFVPSTLESANGSYNLLKQEFSSFSSGKTQHHQDQAHDWARNVYEYDISGSFTLNFAQQRQRPPFRQQGTLSENNNEKWQNSARQVSKLLALKHGIKSCQSYSHLDGRILVQELCTLHGGEDGHIWYVYNILDFPRTWCGHEIPPLSAIQLSNGPCHDEPVRIFPVDKPPVSGSGMPPIQFRRENVNDNGFQPVECGSIQCEFSMDTCRAGTGRVCLPEVSSWKVEGTPFQFLYTDSPPNSHLETTLNPKAFRNHQYLASRSLKSEIPLSAFDWKGPFARNPIQPPSMEEILPKVVFVQSKEQCQGGTRAENWAKAIQTSWGQDKLDSLGSCFNTQKPPTEYGNLETNREDRMKLFGKYMFTLVVDRSVEADNISELIWEALWAGSIPIHVGAINIQDYVPQDSVITAGTLFGNHKDRMGPFLQQIMKDPTLWNKYHAWRNVNSDAWRKWWEKSSFLQTPPYCRMCRWAYAKQYGLGWDHVKQQLHTKPTVLDRRVCIADNDLLTGSDFREWWLTPADYRGPKGKTQQCGVSTATTATIEFETHAVTRTVLAHDNVLDIWIHKTESKEDSGALVLRLEIGGGKSNKLQNREAAHFPHVHTLFQKNSAHVSSFSSVAIQDDLSKVTVLANWPTSIFVSSPGKIDVLVQSNGDDYVLPDETRRLRIIVENLDPLRDVPTEYNFSPFASKLARDFLDPLELYYYETSNS